MDEFAARLQPLDLVDQYKPVQHQTFAIEKFLDLIVTTPSWGQKKIIPILGSKIKIIPILGSKKKISEKLLTALLSNNISVSGKSILSPTHWEL